MSLDPLTEAHSKLRLAFLSAIGPVCDQDTDGLDKVYWKRASQAAAAPFVVVQPQGDGTAIETVGDIGWIGDVVIKSYGADEGQCEDLLTAAALAIAGISAPSGYALSVRWANPIALPDADGLAAAGQRYHVELYRAM